MPALRRLTISGLIAVRAAAPGLIVAIALAMLARAMAGELAAGVGGLPKFPLSPVMCAVMLGMLWRNTVGVPSWATGGSGTGRCTGCCGLASRSSACV